jgi:DNA-binding IscR family transcriptional regulator
MAASCRFAFAIHVLAVLAYRDNGGGDDKRGKSGGACSDTLAGSVNTNPVVIRRLLSQLRNAGLVETHKGMRGGAVLGLAPEAITLDAVYRAVERRPSFAAERPLPDQGCPVGAGITRVLDEVFASAQAALEAALKRCTLGDVLTAMREEAASRRTERLAAGKAA